MMPSLIEIFTEYISWISLTISVVFGILGVLPFYLQKKKKPKYVIVNRPIISNSQSDCDDLQVFYGGNLVDNLTETRIFIWNAGKKAIRKYDLVKATPICINNPDGVKLYKIEYVSTLKLGKTFDMHENEDGDFELSFDAMQKNDGVCIRLFHSGSEDCLVGIKGEFNDLLKLKNSTFSDPDVTGILSKINPKVRAFLPFLMLFSSITVGIYAIINQISLEILTYNMQFSMSPFTQRAIEETFGIVEGNGFIQCIALSIFLLLIAIGLFHSISVCIPNELLVQSKKTSKAYKSSYMRIPPTPKRGRIEKNESESEKS